MKTMLGAEAAAAEAGTADSHSSASRAGATAEQVAINFMVVVSSAGKHHYCINYLTKGDGDREL